MLANGSFAKGGPHARGQDRHHRHRYAAHAALSLRGVDVDAEVMRMGDPVPPMFFFRDPDGNALHLTEGR